VSRVLIPPYDSPGNLRKTKRRLDKLERSPCNRPPAAPDGVRLTFQATEARTHLRFSGKIKWNEVRTDSDGFVIQHLVDLYEATWIACDSDGNPLEIEDQKTRFHTRHKVPPQHQEISAATASSNVATYTTPENHERIVGDKIEVRNIQPPAYDGFFTVASVPTPKTLRANIGATPPAMTNHHGLLIDDNDSLHVLIEDVPRPKTWWWKARVRARAGQGCWSQWSGWTDPILPWTGADPKPPVPQNVTLTFDTVERSRHDRIRALVRCDEVGPFDYPGTSADREDDMALYVFQLQKSEDGVTWDSHTRTLTRSAKGQETDANDTTEVVFGRIRKRYLYRARARTIDRYHRRSDWSAWNPVSGGARPNDNTPPPDPLAVAFVIDEHHYRVTWNVPNEPTDTTIPDESYAFAEVQISQFADFSVIKLHDRVVAEHAHFKATRPAGTLWARVRLVDSSWNKSNWVAVSSVPLVPNVPAINSITFDANGTRHARYRALVQLSDPSPDVDARVSYFVVEFCHKAANTTPDANDRKHRERVDPDTTSDFIAVFHNVRKDHYTFARVRKVDTQGRVSNWTGWLAGGRPSVAIAPAAPVNAKVTNPGGALIIDWDLPGETDLLPDGSGLDEEVDLYRVEIYQGSNPNPVRTRHIRGDHFRYDIPRADRGTAHHAKVYAISDLATPSTPLLSDVVDTTEETVHNEDVLDDDVRYTKFKVSGAKAYSSNDQTIADSSDEVLGLNKIAIDTDGSVDILNDMIKLNWANLGDNGVYHVQAKAQFARGNAVGRRKIQIQRRDGLGGWVDIAGAQMNVAAAPQGPTDVVFSEVMALSVAFNGTWLRARVFHNDGAALQVNHGQHTKYLSVMYLGSADTFDTSDG